MMQKIYEKKSLNCSPKRFTTHLTNEDQKKVVVIMENLKG